MHRGADDQAQRMTPGKRSRASTTAAGRRAAPNHGGRAAAARNLRHNANRARPSTGKHTPRLGHSVPGARERGWLLAREGSFRDPLQDHARIIPRPGGRRDCNQSSRAACRSIRAPWASGWRAGDAALSAQRRVPDGVRPRVTREVRSGCVAAALLAECLVLWFCVSLLCDRRRRMPPRESSRSSLAITPLRGSRIAIYVCLILRLSEALERRFAAP